MATRGFNLRVRNFLGVSKGDVLLDRIVLVGGVNGAGKSSLIEACASIALETPLARGMTSRKGAAALLRAGSDAGSISLTYAGGGRRLIYPEATLEMSGAPTWLGSALGIGSARLMGLKPDDRLAQMQTRFEMQPRIDDLRSWFTAHPEAGMGPVEVDGVEVDPVALLWERIELSGWDAVHKNCVEHSQRTRGAWQAVTGANWGRTASRTWTPPELLPGEDYDAGRERTLVQIAQHQLEQLIADAAIANRDREALSALVATRPVAEAMVARLTARGEELGHQSDELAARHAAIPVAIDVSKLPDCPHCGKKIEVLLQGARRPILKAAPDPATRREITASTAAFKAIDDEITAVKNLIAANTEDLAAAIRDVQRCKDADFELGQTEIGRPVEAGEVEAARTALADQQRKVAAIENLAKARGIYAEWQRNEALVAALHPDGVRQTAMGSQLGEINVRLGALSATARWSAVELSPTMEASYDGRPYALLSKSEQWRVDLTLTALLAEKEAAKLILADGLDILAPQSRPGVIYLLKSLGIPALVAMTGKDIEVMPKIQSAGLGKVLWIESGAITDPYNT